jgi:hypothetical protein
MLFVGKSKDLGKRAMDKPVLDLDRSSPKFPSSTRLQQVHVEEAEEGKASSRYMRCL